MYFGSPSDDHSPNTNPGKFGPVLERRTTEMRKIRLKKRFPMIMENVESCEWIKCLVQCLSYFLGPLLLSR